MTWSRGPGVWLLVTGIFELLLAAFFLILGVVIPEVLFGFGLTAIFLGIVGLGLLAWGAHARARSLEAERIRATGRAGQATVMGLSQTGMSINNNPVVALDLLVELAAQAPYRVTLRETVPEILVARVTSGVPLPVKVDHADPMNVVVDWTLAGPMLPPLTAPLAFPAAGWPAPATPLAGGTPLPGSAVASAAPPGAQGWPPPAAAATANVSTATVETAEEIAERSAWQLAASRLRAIGRRATATVGNALDTGRSIDGQRVFSLTLTIRPEAGDPYQVTHTAPVPAAEIPGLTPGAPLPVRVDPTDPKQIVMDWHRVD